ncbi:MAG: O-antigen ligase family protein [Acidobacteriota bacterium]
MRIPGIEIEQSDDEGVKPSKLNAIVFGLILSIPVVFTVLYGGVDTWAIGLHMLFALLILGLWSLDSIKKGAMEISAEPMQMPLLGLAIIGLMQIIPFASNSTLSSLSVDSATALSVNPFATRYAVVQLFIYVIFFAAALSHIDSYKRLRIATAVFLTFTSMMAFIGILQFLTKPDAIYGLRPTPQSEPFASYVNKHHFAGLMEMTFGVALSLVIGGGAIKEKRLLVLLALSLSGIAVVLTGSRGGLLSILVVSGMVVAIHLLFRKQGNESDAEQGESGGVLLKRLAIIGGSLSLVAVIVGSTLLLGGGDSLLRGAGFTGQDDVSSGRLHFWAVTWEVFIHNPFFGVGLDALGNAYTEFDTWSGQLRLEQAHNEYLQLMAEAGIGGLLLAVGFIWTLFRKAARNIVASEDLFARSVALGALAGCTGVLVHSFFDFPLRIPSNAYFFLICCVLAVVAVKGPRRHRSRARRG